MSPDPHNGPRRDDVDPPEDATARIDPVPPGPVSPEADAPAQSGVESYSADWPASPSGTPASQHHTAEQGGYASGEPGQGQHQPQYGQHQAGQYGQYGQGQYGQDQYGQDQYGQPQAAQYRQDQYGHPQTGQYGQDQQGQYGQPQHHQDPSHGGEGYGAYGGYGSGAAFGHPDQKQPRAKRTVGVGGLALAVLLAGLLGGGVVAGTQAVLDDGSISTSSTGGIEINNPDSATVVTAAAAKASPSVVTLAVNEGGQGGSGSGIILDEEGHVLTNTHVVTLGGAAPDPEIQVRMSDGSVSDATLVGTDPLSDLAVIQLEDIEGIQPAELGSSGDLNVGDQSIAIGAPLGLAGTVTDGIVSTLNRTISVASSAVEDEGGDAPEAPEEGAEEDGFEFYFPDMEGSPTQGSIHLNVIQTDAAINRGNSGGALVDDEGRVIGVNVAIASSGGGAESDAGSIGVGFAVPIDYAQRVAQELIETGEVSHGLLGVTVAAAGSQEVPDETDTGLAPVMPGFTVGALIDDVPGNTPAAEAGLATGDIITAVNDRRIEDSLALTATIREYAAGETVTISYTRDGQQEETEVTLGAT
ncbi:trypsin-like peptidase domain-containing protein [Nesterenkonia sp. E16_7]|uniref:S1C family serine protease n=1 Tax=unclassified Nesterenkonia TaxID=2629769 RepID=UPI001A924E89|nr:MULTISPECIES: trypsin-like peptidase domain-containing protein [unclassified Nesterenkonia]MBO0594344.1 trypsin-like peptidase domain-containing protein [Nesterenkonia sp. E16_10]MBO0598446.1 trypsin-like peptidase domain-containing protein [Nesterenkonia sp. E16_7]